MASIMKILLPLLACMYYVSAQDVNLETLTNTINDIDMCLLDDLAAILCDLCNAVEPQVSRETCCYDPDMMWVCEKLLMGDDPKLDDEAANDYSLDYNSVEPDYFYNEDYYYDPQEMINADKRAQAWSYKKPTAHRLHNAMYDLGFRGKRYSTTGRYSWKPTNYRFGEKFDVGFRGKRQGFLPSEYGSNAYPFPDHVSKRAYSSFDWKPAAYRLSNPYRYDHLGYMGKRSESEENDVEKRARYNGRYNWKPAPYRLDSDYMWDRYGKRAYNSYTSSPSRFDWKPHSSFYDDYMSKRSGGNLWWKPSSYVGIESSRPYEKRFNIGMGRWNWKPQDSSSSSRDKRGRYDWKPSTGYFGYGFDHDSTMATGKRPYAQFDWKPRSSTYRKGEEKRGVSLRSWKPWRPAAYRIGSDRLFGKK